MLSFLHYTRLVEDFKSPVPWRWDTPAPIVDPSSLTRKARRWDAAFTVDDVRYDVHFYETREDSDEPFPTNCWELLFVANKDDVQRKKATQASAFAMAKPNLWDGSGVGITGTGHQMTVFATVIDILKAMMQKLRPVRVDYTAEETEPSRQKLYARMTKHAHRAFPGYVGHMNANRTIFQIVRRGPSAESMAPPNTINVWQNK